jgi:hypothetical protein
MSGNHVALAEAPHSGRAAQLAVRNRDVNKDVIMNNGSVRSFISKGHSVLSDMSRSRSSSPSVQSNQESMFDVVPMSRRSTTMSCITSAADECDSSEWG